MVPADNAVPGQPVAGFGEFLLFLFGLGELAGIADGDGTRQAPRAATEMARAGVRAGPGPARQVRGQGRGILPRHHATRRRRYGVADLSDLYHGRWSIEELYKVSKNFIEVDDFHALSERGAEQEPYAHFNLIAATRPFANDGDGLLELMREEAKPPLAADFKNALAVVAANLEELLLAGAKALAEAVSRTAERILAVRSRLRPNRSYPRRSMKPVGKWARRRGSIEKVLKAPAAQTLARPGKRGRTAKEMPLGRIRGADASVSNLGHGVSNDLRLLAFTILRH